MTELLRQSGDCPSLVLGVDIGGTKIATVAANSRGEVVARGYGLTEAARGPEAVVDSICGVIRQTLSDAGLASAALLGIGIAAAGSINGLSGTVVHSPHLPGWHDVPLRDIVARRFGLPVFLDNDANLAAVAENRWGAGQGAKDLIYITVSTGIGGGIIIGGKLYAGATGTAGEVGHMTIDVNGVRCPCGNTGCWETLASGGAIAADAVKQIAGGVATTITDIAGGRENIDAKAVFQAARQGDALAKKVIARAAYCLGVGLVNLVNIFNPEVILVGGGVANMGDMMLRPAIKLVRERAFQPAGSRVTVKRAQLGNDAGPLGAVAMVVENTSKSTDSVGRGL